MKKVFQLFAFIAFISTTSCSIEGIEGSGNIVSESRTVNGKFNAIDVSGIIDLNVIQGDSVSIIATDDNNLLPFLETRLQNDILIIRRKDNTSIRNGHASLTITVPQLNHLSISGTGNLTTPKSFKFNDLKLFSSGTGSVILRGSIQNLTIKQSSTGKVNTFDCPTQKIDVSNFGTGDSKINVLDEMRVIIGGTGNVIFKGEPRLMSSEISGTGVLKRF